MRVSGVAHVWPASNWFGALIARVMNFPEPKNAVPVQLEVVETRRGTEWRRTFGKRRVCTVQRIIAGHMVECRGPGRLFFKVVPDPHGVSYESVRFDLFRIPIPRAFSPRAKGRVKPTGGGWQVEIEVSLPFVGRLTGYVAKMGIV